MSRIVPLRLGPLEAAGFHVRRSGIRWLCPEGHTCRAGEPIAFCNIALHPHSAADARSNPFPQEQRDFQVVFATRVGGRLRRAAQASHGGSLDQLDVLAWVPDFSPASIEQEEMNAQVEEDPGLLRLLMVTGRRMTELAEVRTGLMTGWHDRSRAWWGEGEGERPPATLLSMATCEQAGLLKGESSSFFDLFAAISGPAHVVVTQDEPVLPCARVLYEQMIRTDEQRRTILHDLAAGFAQGAQPPTGQDWLFMGAIATALERRALDVDYPILTRTGLLRAPPARIVVMSSNAEVRHIARHRRLGYAVAFHDFRLNQAGPGVIQWLRANFERISRSIDDVRADYVALLDHLRASTGARLVVMNAYSTPVHDDVRNYAAFARPMSDTSASLRAKEFNLMLHDLARDHALDILDVDAAVARIGARSNLPDGTHHSGRLQDLLRAELLAILREHRLPGFDAR